MASKRSQIYLYPLGSTVYGYQPNSNAPMPPAWEPKADVQIGDGTGGVLVLHRDTHLFALWTGSGSVETLPQDKVAHLLAKMEAAGR